MAYHDDLLSQALQLIHSLPSTQASLRRAVSTAYYAVFHLLIAEAAANWNNVGLRPALGRAYDHGTMRAASNRLQDTREFPFAGQDPVAVKSVRLIAGMFSQLQQDRHFADYNLTKDLKPTDAISQVNSAVIIFEIWASVRTGQIAQEYLVSLVVKHR